jgi:acetyltransferase
MTILRLSNAGRFAPQRFFHPASLRVIGQGALAEQVTANLRAGGFSGPLDAASPDLAVIAQADDAAATLADLAGRGVFGAVCLCAPTGLAEAAKASGVRVMGPDSFGLAIPALKLDATLGHLPPRPGRLALVSQSASLCRAVLDWAEPNGVGFSCIAGIGGNADLGFSAVLDWLSRDSGTGAILLDIRRIRNRRAFLSAARAAARLRPVVALRAGGRMADPSGLADAALEAALRRAGVLSVSTFDDLLAAAETLSRAKPARGESLAIVTNATAPGWLAADAALRDGLAPAALSAETRRVLGISWPEMNAGAHPIDTGDAPPSRLAEAAAMLGGAREVGGVLVVHSPTGPGDDAAMDALAACHKAMRVPLLVCAMGETTGGPHRRRLAEAGVPVFAAPEQAVRGFLHLVQDRRNRALARELPDGDVLAVAADAQRVRRLFARARAAGRLRLSPDDALDVLSAYGVPAVPGRVVHTPEDAATAASMLGFPIALKLRSDDAEEATIFDLDDEAAVADAAERLADPASGPSFLVQRQVPHGRELRIHVSDDAMVGPVIAVGSSGAGAAIELPPLNLPLAHALVVRAGLAAAASEEAAEAEALVRISQLVVDFPEIASLSVDPLFADADGVAAGDAALTLRADGEPLGLLAIAPYPGELEERWLARGRDGRAPEELVIRPIRPEDAQAHGAFFRRLSPEDVRYRFFSAMRELSPEQTVRMTQVDYDREMAFVAVRAGADGPETVGVSRLVCEPGGRRGEFAVVVQPDMKGRGLATHLMRRLLDWARQIGLAEVAGEVLADNHPMLAFVRSLGFELHHLPDAADVVEARLRLTPAS